MYSIPLQRIASDLGYAYLGPNHLVPRHVAIDSRKCQEDTLFIALVGTQTDGHRFLDQAYAAGARSFVVSEEEAFQAREGVGVVFAPQGGDVFLQDLARWMRSLYQGPVVAVTGSQGKTSTKDLLAQILRPNFTVVATEGNHNNELGLPLTLTQLQEDTTLLLLEMGMDRPGDIAFLGALARPTAGIITGIGLAHAEHFGSQDQIGLAKAELFPHIQDGGKVYLRTKDRIFLEESLHASSAQGIWCCIDKDCLEGYKGCVAKDLQLKVDRSDFTCTYGTSPPFRVQLPFAGAHYVDNALLAIACARDLGVSIECLQDNLPKLRGESRDRMAYHLLSTGALIINDTYNANPDSMQATLAVLAAYKPSRVLACLGDMKELGPYEEKAHKALGAYVKEKDLDRLIAFGPAASLIAQGAREAGYPPERIVVTQDKEICSDDIFRFAGPDSIILVKGSRSMAMEEIVKGVREKDIRRGDL